jgi:hypothetical protein
VSCSGAGWTPALSRSSAVSPREKRSWSARNSRSVPCRAQPRDSRQGISAGQDEHEACGPVADQDIQAVQGLPADELVCVVEDQPNGALQLAQRFDELGEVLRRGGGPPPGDARGDCRPTRRGWPRRRRQPSTTVVAGRCRHGPGPPRQLGHRGRCAPTRRATWSCRIPPVRTRRRHRGRRRGRSTAACERRTRQEPSAGRSWRAAPSARLVRVDHRTPRPVLRGSEPGGVPLGASHVRSPKALVPLRRNTRCTTTRSNWIAGVRGDTSAVGGVRRQRRIQAHFSDSYKLVARPSGRSVAARSQCVTRLAAGFWSRAAGYATGCF